MQSLIKLQEHEDDPVAAFWGDIEEKFPLLDEGEEMNSVLGLIGTLCGMVGSIVTIVGLTWPALTMWKGVNEVGWWEWSFAALLAGSLGFQLFGLVKFLMAAEEPNGARAFRSWRTNLLGQGLHTIIQLANMLVWAVIVILAQSFVIKLLEFAFHLSGIVLALLGLWLVFYQQNWWWNLDPEGAMRYVDNWDFWGNDDHWDEILKEDAHHGDHDHDADVEAEEEF